jgi:hypothetical protein
MQGNAYAICSLHFIFLDNVFYSICMPYKKYAPLEIQWSFLMLIDLFNLFRKIVTL